MVDRPVIFCIRDLQTGAIVPVAGDADPTALLHAGAVDNALDSRVVWDRQ